MGPVIYGLRPLDPDVNRTRSRERPGHVTDRTQTRAGNDFLARKKAKNKISENIGKFQQFRVKMNE